ncbi:MAG: hypothetical protein WC887_01235 [Candidatus Paceibacterota bacterium]|jgi:hypothetical protein
MTIAEAREKCKATISKIPRDILIITVLVLASSSSFGLGYLAGFDAGLSEQAGQGSGAVLNSPSLATTTPGGEIVASKSGTKYYLSSCASASRISEANKIWFTSAEAAAAAGYTPAANCKGI